MEDTPKAAHTPSGHKEANFRGFSAVKGASGGDFDNVMYKRRINALESTVSELMDKFKSFEQENTGLKKIILEVQKENLDLKAKVTELMEKQENNEVTVKDNEKKVTEINNKYSEWAKIQEEKTSLKEIMEQEKKNREENLTKQVLKVIKEKENIVRDTVDKKKCVVMYGIEEREQPIRHVREKEERKIVKDIITVVQEEDEDLKEEIEEVYRLGKYQEGRSRPIKVKFSTQTTAEKVLEKKWKLANKEECKRIFIRKDMNEEERAKMSELVKEMKTKNELRTEAEKAKFYWKIRDQRLKKWIIGGEDQATTE